jgi:quercetin dioxygenase-like cupin family protein
MSEQVSRRMFGNVSLASVLAVVAASQSSARAAAFAGASASRREVIKQTLPGDPPREITLVEVNYPPDTGSPPHQHANGVMAYVVLGSIASKVGDAPERTYRAGEAWWEPVGAVHRVSRNTSSTEPATLLAIYIAPAGATAEQLMKPM